MWINALLTPGIYSVQIIINYRGLNMSEVKTVAITGNRDILYSAIKEKLDAISELYPGAAWISGGSVGTELIAAKYAMLNKIPLYMCLPFPFEIMTAQWLKGWQSILEATLNYAEKVSVVSDAFSFTGYQECSERIAGCADIVVAFNLHSSGSSTDFMQYAESIGKQIVNGFSLSTLKVAELHSDLWTHPIKSGIITTDGILNSYENDGVLWNQ